mmetsp:Transcript_24257/g.71712  ORF Transcript_24257/g.71712 Transcript_24257/m.71712 type:complete len:740 (-) Transcript_24257:1603-3822(-)
MRARARGCAREAGTRTDTAGAERCVLQTQECSLECSYSRSPAARRARPPQRCPNGSAALHGSGRRAAHRKHARGSRAGKQRVCAGKGETSLVVLDLLLFGALLLRVVLRADDSDEEVDAAAELDGGARLEEPVEAKLWPQPDLALELLPPAVAELVGHAEEEAVLLLVEELAAVVAVLEREVVPRVVPRRLDLARQQRRHLGLLRNLLLALLDLLGDLLPVADVGRSEPPERLRVGGHLLQRLRAEEVLRDVVQLVAPVLLGALDEPRVVVARPVLEAGRVELLELLLLGDLLGRRLLVGHLLPRLGKARRRLCALELALVFGLVQLVDALHVEELVVLHVGHLRPLRLARLGGRLRRGRARAAVRVALVVRDGGGALALAHRVLHHFDKLAVALLRHRLVVDALELLKVDLGVGKVEQVALLLALELLAALGGQVLCAGEDRVDVLLGDRISRAEDLVRAVPHRGEGLLLAERLLLLGEPALLDDGVVHLQLLLRALDNLLLDRVLGDEAEDLDLLLLPDPVRAVHRLQVGLRVPVAVEEDDCVGRLEVEPEPARARREHKDEVVRARRVELAEQLAAILALGAAVEAEVLVVAQVEVELEQVHQLHHLREDEHAVAERLQLWQDAVEELELARAAPEQVRVVAELPELLGGEEEVWVVADLAQLHLDVVESGHLELPGRADRAEALVLDLAVHELLHRRQLALDHVLRLVGQLRLDVRLEPPQQKGAQHLVQPVDDE